ncbi:hypothetical protein PS9374_03782 [Planomonospora sphaerica]|uniref:Uncharacterized protein n=1 Tax=Planomonospora sphaerica TaxID=161355 RepID=A0A171DE88_9ACTN|nr:hypothetical protein PS9374_03782 [Planomonospora sphaerica]
MPTSAQPVTPAGSGTVTVEELTVMNSSSPSPPATCPGTVTECVVTLALDAADPTNSTSVDGCTTEMFLVTETVTPRSSVTESLTG